MSSTLIDLCMTVLVGLGVRELWAMRKELACIKATFAEHRTHVDRTLDDHEKRLREGNL